MKSNGTKFLLLMVSVLCALIFCDYAIAAEQQKVTITLAQRNDIISFDPHGTNDMGSGTLLRHIYDPLVRVNEKNEIIPSLAESWEFPDDKTIKFNLRKGVTYHNGYPFTAEDVKFSLERQKASPKQGTMIIFLENCEIVDDYTVLVHLNEPANFVLLAALTRNGSGIVSKRYTQEIEAAGKTLNEAPVGTGPYKFVSFQSNDRTVLETNPNYFLEVKNDGIILRCIPDSTARTIALETGEVDALLEIGAVDATLIRNNPNLVLETYQSAQFEYMGFNTTKAPFNDIRVRHAFMHLVNRDHIIRVAENGEADPNYSPLPAGAAGYSPDVKHYDYDVEKAKALLAEAGYPDGLEVTYHTSDEHRLRIAQVLQASFAQAGIRLRIEPMEAAALYDFLDAKMHQIGALNFGVTVPSPDGILRQYFHSKSTGVAANIWGVSDPRYDALVDSSTVESDPVKRQAMYTKLQQMAIEDALICPFYTVRGFVARKATLKGFAVHPLNMHLFYNLHFN